MRDENPEWVDVNHVRSGPDEQSPYFYVAVALAIFSIGLVGYSIYSTSSQNEQILGLLAELSDAKKNARDLPERAKSDVEKTSAFADEQSKWKRALETAQRLSAERKDELERLRKSISDRAGSGPPDRANAKTRPALQHN